MATPSNIGIVFPGKIHAYNYELQAFLSKFQNFEILFRNLGLTCFKEQNTYVVDKCYGMCMLSQEDLGKLIDCEHCGDLYEAPNHYPRG